MGRLPGTDDGILPRPGTGPLPETCRPTIVDAGTRAAYVGPSFTLGRHRNAVAVLAVGLQTSFDLGTRDDRRDGTARRHALIPPGRWHWLDARGGAMGFLYLDAGDAAWRPLEAWEAIDVERVAGAFLALSSAPLPAREAWCALTGALGLPASTPEDARILDAMERVRRDPARRHAASSQAARMGCAVSTFQRRFTAAAGLPWRRWRQWQRLRFAARAVCEGVDLTTAAHAAGFASGSHFSDVFRATFGLAPSRLVDWGVAWRVVGD